MKFWTRVGAFGLLGVVPVISGEAQDLGGQPAQPRVQVQVGANRSSPITRGISQYEGLKSALSASQLFWASQQGTTQKSGSYHSQLRQQAQEQARKSLAMLSTDAASKQGVAWNTKFTQAAQQYRQTLFDLCGLPQENQEGQAANPKQLTPEEFAQVTLINYALCQAIDEAEWSANTEMSRYFTPDRTSPQKIIASFLVGQPGEGAVAADAPAETPPGKSSVSVLAQAAQQVITNLRPPEGRTKEVSPQQ